MSGTAARPLHRRLTIVLNGSNARFQEDLNTYMRQSSSVTLVGYHVLNTPVTATVPNTPYLTLEFEQGGGFEMAPMITNTNAQNAILMPLSGLNTSRDCSGGIILGEMRGSRAGQVTISVRDHLGQRHDPSSNKLFDWLTLELVILETGRQSTPSFLIDLPQIQPTLNTL